MRLRRCLHFLVFLLLVAGLCGSQALAQDGITSLQMTDANGNPIAQGTEAYLRIATNNVTNYSILIGPDPSQAGGYYPTSCYLSFNVTFDSSGNAVTTVTLLDQYGNYSDPSQRGQLSATGAVQFYSLLSNGHCSVNLANSSVVGGAGSGSRWFNVAMDITFQSGMNGPQGIYENYSSYSSTYGSYSTGGLISTGQSFTVGSGVGVSSISTSSPVIGGNATTLAVNLTGPAPSGGASVSITSSNTSVIPSSSVIIGAGQSSGSTSIGTNSVGGSTPVTLTASYNGTSQSAQVTVNPAPTFNLSLTSGPTPAAVLPGATASAAVGMQPYFGFNSTVTLSQGAWQNQTGGGGVSGITTTITQGGAASAWNLSIAVNGSVAAGTYVQQITASGGGVVKTVPVTIAVQGFTLSASTTTASVQAGQTGFATVTVTPINGFSGAVTLSAGSWPAGITLLSISPNPVSAGSPTASVTFAVGAGVTPSGYTLQSVAPAAESARAKVPVSP